MSRFVFRNLKPWVLIREYIYRNPCSYTSYLNYYSASECHLQRRADWEPRLDSLEEEREREREERWPELGAMLRSGQREEEADLKQDRIVTIMTSAVGTTLKGRE